MMVLLQYSAINYLIAYPRKRTLQNYKSENANLDQGYLIDLPLLLLDTILVWLGI